MNKFVGTKTVQATPRTRKEHHDWLNSIERCCCGDANPNEEGYTVEYPDGYVSWSPKETFEKAYHSAEAMTFGEAIAAMKQGARVARKGWNGKGMFVVYQKGYPEGIPCNKNTAEAFGYKEGDLFICRPYMQMRCADGTHQMWLASQSDVLAEDWYIV